MATRSLGSLTIDLIAKIGGLKFGMSQAERELDKKTKKIKGDAEKLGKAIGTYIGGAMTAVIWGVRNTIKELDQLALMSQQIGTTTESLSGLRYAAEQMAGVSEGQFDMALRRMTRRISEAADGAGPAAAALRALGLSAEGLVNLSPDEQFRRLADAMKQTEDQGTRLRATMAIFDTEGMPLVNMLKEGAEGIRAFELEADRLGVTIDRNTVLAAREFGKELRTVNAIKDGLYNSITAELLPMLTALTKRFTDTAKGGDNFAKTVQVAVSGVKLLASAVASVIGTLKTWGEALGGLVAATVALLEGRFRDAANIAKEVGKDFVDNVKSTVADIEVIWADADIKVDLPETLPPVTVPISFKEDDTAKKALEAATRYVDSLRAQLRATENLTTVETVLRDIQEGRLKLAGDVTREMVLNLARQVDAAKELNDLMTQGAALTAAMRTPAEVFADELARIDSLLDAGVISYETYARAVKNASEAFDSSRIKQTNDAARELGMTFSSAFEDAIVSGNKLSDVLKGLLEDIARIAVRQSVTAPLANYMSGLFGGLFSFNAKGNVYDSPSLSRYSNGVYHSPQVFEFAKGVGIFAEAGPEAIMPLHRGPDGTLGVKAVGGGGDIHITINVNADGSDRTERRDAKGNAAAQLGRQLEAAVRGVLMQEKRPGGLLAEA